MKSKYTSPKSVAKNQTVPIGVDDPRLSWDKKGQTYARQGAEVQEIGLDGKSLIAGGTTNSNAGGSSGVDTTQKKAQSYVFVNNQGILIDSNLITPTAVSNVSAVWSKDDLIVTFDWDYNDPLNVTISEFIVELTGDGLTLETPLKQFPVNKTQTQQTLTITRAVNESVFGGNFTVNLTSVCVFAIDAFYNRSQKTCDTTIPPYVLDLPIPVITVTAITNGYSVSYTKPTQSIYDAIEISEYESNAATEPTGVTYNVRYWDISSPANIVVENTNPRWVKARFSSNAKIFTAFCAAQKVTPLSPVTVDTTGPANVTSVSATTGIDTSGYLGFNGYADVSWPAVTGGGIRGYRIRFSNDAGTTYSYADSPGTGTTYRLGGLAIGSTYKIAVATYDEFNNVSSSYVSVSPDITISGTPSVSNYITAGPFQFGIGVGGVSTNKGLYFDASNYWYVNASNSARLKVGGSTSNYLLWDGATFAIDGDITARGGTFSGNILMSTSNASIYNGTISSGGELTGNGFALNSKGLKVANGTNSVTIDAATGSILANAGTIAGWTINANSITKTVGGQGTIDINSSQGYIAVKTTTEVDKLAGINAAKSASESVFWAGGGGTLVGGVFTADPNSSSNAFRVNLAGQLFATSAEITGKITATSGNITGSMDVDGQLNVGNVTIKAVTGSFSITDTVGGYGVISTSEAGRLVLGHYQEDFGRQVKVARSAQIAGNPDGAGAENSGGLRNIFTSTVAQFYSNAYLNVNEANGDVVLLYTP